MELSKKQLRKLRAKVAKPVYPIDRNLIKAALKADAGGNKVYSLLVENPASHLIYRYLTEFTAAAIELHSGKKLKDLTILDWGGGKGYVSYFLRQKGANVTLYETDEFDHKKLWDEFKLKVKTSPGDKLPFDDKTFDAIIGFGVLEHVPYDQQALLEVNRVLKDNGLFFCFNIPNKTSYVHKVAASRGVRYHDRLYTRGEIKNLLKRAGFNVVGKMWFRQLLPKTHYHYPNAQLFENLDLLATSYTPLCYLAASIEFVARKQYTYTSIH